MEQIEIKVKRLELLEDTVRYYSEDTKRRAVNNGNCKYITEDGRKCAIGRLLPNDKIELLKDETSSVYTFIQREKYKNILPDNILALGIEFLRDIQYLHDTDKYWGVNELNQEGKIYLDIIKANYIIN